MYYNTVYMHHTCINEICIYSWLSIYLLISRSLISVKVISRSLFFEKIFSGLTFSPPPPLTPPPPYIHTYIHIHMHTYIHTYIHVCHLSYVYPIQIRICFSFRSMCINAPEWSLCIGCSLPKMTSNASNLFWIFVNITATILRDSSILKHISSIAMVPFKLWNTYVMYIWKTLWSSFWNIRHWIVRLGVYWRGMTSLTCVTFYIRSYKKFVMIHWILQ